MDALQHSRITEYHRLLKAFLRGDLSLSCFEVTYLGTLKNESVRLPAEAFQALDHLFAVVDAYGADASISSFPPSTEAEIRVCAGFAAAKLEALIG
jgi:hypothetical protein